MYQPITSYLEWVYKAMKIAVFVTPSPAESVKHLTWLRNLNFNFLEIMLGQILLLWGCGQMSLNLHFLSISAFS